jgi:hypothetical protein
VSEIELKVLSAGVAEITSIRDGKPVAYTIRGVAAARIIAMYEHLKVCPEGGEAFARTYLYGLAAGIGYEAVEAIRRRYGFDLDEPDTRSKEDPPE